MPRFATARSDGELQDNSRRESLLHHNFANNQQPDYVCLSSIRRVHHGQLARYFRLSAHFEVDTLYL